MSLHINQTNERGYGQPVNPYRNYHENHPYLPSDKRGVKRKEFDTQHPLLLVIDHTGAPVINGSDLRVTKGYLATLRERKTVIEKVECNYYANRGYLIDEVYLLTDPENTEKGKEDNICVICDEDRTGKTFCADCGHNVADERPASLFDKSEVLILAEDIFNRNVNCRSIPENVIPHVLAAISEGINKGATDQEKVMHGEWVKVSEVMEYFKTLNWPSKWWLGEIERQLTLLRNKQQ